MGMYALLCSLSAKRLALIEEDPELLEDLIDARNTGDIPGLLDLDKSWHALQLLAVEVDPVLEHAFAAATGRRLAAGAAFGAARVLPPDHVARIAKALAALPATFVRDRYASLHGKSVHGGFGQHFVGSADKAWLRGKIEEQQQGEIDQLADMLAKVTALYVEAATEKRSMLSVIT